MEKKRDFGKIKRALSDTSRADELRGQAKGIDSKNKMERVKIKKKPKREKLTTVMLPELKRLLKKDANNNDCNMADVLEQILKQYYNV